MEAFVTYKLPFSNTVFCFKGNAINYKNSSDLNNETGFVCNGFNNENNFIIKNLKSIKPSEFKFFESDKLPVLTDKKKYITICNSLINLLKQKTYSKVILSRIEKIKTTKHALSIFNDLNVNYQNTFNYVISVKNIGCWIGATPETLVNINKDVLKTVSIAGTKQTNDNWAIKELEEQQIVTDFIFKTLKKHTENLKQSETTTLNAGKVQHLKTEFTANLKSNWTDIVKALHPTPATCGLPKQKAQQHINKIEPHKREYYTGFLGIINKQQKQLFVNLRCMQIIKSNAYLYLGGGITALSDANNEWEETVKKSTTLSKVL